MMSVPKKIGADSGLSSFLSVAREAVKKASDAVDRMSASAVRMDVISAGIAPTARLSEVAGNPEDLVVGVYITVSGDIPGHSLLVFPYESALHLVDLMTGQQSGVTKRLGEMEESVIQEVGNIVTGSYINAIADYYGHVLIPSPPSLAIDMTAAVIDSVLLNTGHFDEDTISIVTRFAGSKKAIRGFFLYIPEIVASS